MSRITWQDPPNPNRLRGVAFLGGLMSFGFLLSGIGYIQAFGGIMLLLSASIYSAGSRKVRRSKVSP